MPINFFDQVAIVTGAGNGLGRSHALALAERGAKVVVNDLGESAQETTEQIIRKGGEAIAHNADVTDFEQVQDMVSKTQAHWGRVDILINNAGILRDKSFAKMELEDFRKIIDVHLMGSVHCTKAVWEIMRSQSYGRIVMTASSTGLYGNFGQANYGAAKMALVGLMNTLSLEGEKYNIKVNTIAPAAYTQMTECVINDEQSQELLTPESVTAGVLALCRNEAPNRTILCAGAGSYSSSHIVDTDGVHLPENQQTPEGVVEHWEKIVNLKTTSPQKSGFDQINKLVNLAIQAHTP